MCQILLDLTPKSVIWILGFFNFKIYITNLLVKILLNYSVFTFSAQNDSFFMPTFNWKLR